MKVSVKMYQSYPKYGYKGKKIRNVVIASGEFDTETKKVVVKKGSKYNPYSMVIDNKIVADRKQLEDEGIVANDEFVKDHEFKTLSTASTLIRGRGDRGTYSWIEDVSGKNIIVGGVIYLICTDPSIKDINILINKLKACNKKDIQESFNELVSFSSGKHVVEEIDEEHDVEDEFAEVNLPDQKITDKLEEYCGQNVIFYGVPGCGKSYTIKQLLKGIDECYYKRILFHPEYSYSDFIGQIVPTIVDGKPTYSFAVGPMTQILKEAIANDDQQYFLVIEEINRGNAPAIFGDFFQLLDRKNGKSEYPIDNAEIAKIIGATDGKVSIPENLTIFATMNTCDQNVFTLDTAFKRRFRMSRIKNAFPNDQRKITFSSGRVLEWKAFAEAVNIAILNNCNDGASAEDKQLGAFFVKENELEAQIFAEKIFMYLWDDVVKYDKEQLFKSIYKTLDKVIEDFVGEKNVFNERCESLNALFEEFIIQELDVSDNTEETEE